MAFSLEFQKFFSTTRTILVTKYHWLNAKVYLNQIEQLKKTWCIKLQFYNSKYVFRKQIDVRCVQWIFQVLVLKVKEGIRISKVFFCTCWNQIWFIKPYKMHMQYCPNVGCILVILEFVTVHVRLDMKSSQVLHIHKYITVCF